MKKLLPIFLLMIVSVYCFGQNVDSLYYLYLDAKGGRRIALVNEIAQTAYTLECTDTLYNVNYNTKPELAAAIVNELVASYAEYILNDLAKAVKFALNAAQLYEQLGDISGMDISYSNAATYYFRMGDHEKAIDLMLKCYELESQMNDTEAMGTTLNNLGVVYSTWGKSDVAVECFRRAVEIERPMNRPMQYAGRLSQLAKENAILGNYDEALRLIKEALACAEKIERNEREERIAVHQRIMGNIYDKMDSLPQAQKCYQHAISVFEKNNRQQQLAESLLGLGHLQLRQNHFTEAIKTLKYCIDICEKNRLRRTLRDASRFLYEAYKQTGHSAQALSYFEQYNNLNDSIFKETTQKQISEFQVKYETVEKQFQIERQQAEIEKHKIRQFIYSGGLFMAGLLIMLLIYVIILRTRRNRLLAETNATKDKFFSIISHDLKNPAISQRDALQLLLDNSGQWDTASVTEYYRKLLKSANDQVDLLFTLLGWAQIQTRRMPYLPVQFDLTVALQPCIRLIKNMAEAKDITFNVRMPEAAIVTGDYNMISTVVRNLLTNAVKFTAKSGTITLDISVMTCCRDAINRTDATHRVSVSAGFSISITDTGTGMSSEQIQNLFRLDRQHSRKGTAGEQGSGLGLIVCKELLQKHGSQLYIESEEGKGSRFCFELKILQNEYKYS